MIGLGKLTKLAGPRLLLAGVIITGMLGSQGGNGTLAFFTSTVSTTATFKAGVVDLTGQIGGGTASVLPGAEFTWDTSAVGTANCYTTLVTTNIAAERGEAMAPGHYCIAPLTISNNSSSALDAWLRMRLVRNTRSDTHSLSGPPTTVNRTLYTVGGSGNAVTGLQWSIPAGATITYTYSVTAVATNTDASSGETLATSVTQTMPASTAARTGRVVLSWTPILNATSYKIYRSGGDQATGLLATVDNGTTSYIDNGTVPITGGSVPATSTPAGVSALSGPPSTFTATPYPGTTGATLSANTTYTYYIVAKDGTGSTEARTFYVKTGAIGSVYLAWANVTSNTGYIIYRTGADCTGVCRVVTTAANVVSYSDTGTPEAAADTAPVIVNGSASNAPGSNDRQNDRLRLYVSEYRTNGATAGMVGTGSTAADAARAAARNADCQVPPSGTATFFPSTSNSTATIADVANINASGVDRVALSSLTAFGKQLGRVLDPLQINVVGQGGGANLASDPNVLGNLDLRDGTGLDSGNQPVLLENVTNVTNVTAGTRAMNTTIPAGGADAIRTAYNILGDDEVSNPATTTLFDQESELVNTFGTDASPNSAPAVRYYCVGLFFPSNSQLAGAGTTPSPDITNTSGDNLAQSGRNVYTLHIAAAQKAGR